MKDPGATFSAVCQLGPIVAIVLYFRSDLVRYVAGIVRTKSPSKIPADDLDAKLGWFTLLGTIPMAVFGLLLEKLIDKEFRSLYVTAASLILLALVLVYAEKVGKKSKGLKSLTLSDSQKIGWAQVLALVPGASRSGVTITAGLFLGLTRESAARFSFLLSIPAISAAGLYKLYKVIKLSHGLGGQAAPYILSAVVAGIVAYAVVNWFLRFMKEHATTGFIIYRIVLGVALIGLLGAGIVKTQAPTTLEGPATSSATLKQ
jgi:undecaprenyl-diphosphatase